ncbi:hypothetical protein [Vibrio metschnikovii]|uniref:hypothetical protein n=1 Tax=Vibrio metschnikovii TaxID=28172 RepID=UPI001C2F8B64|nr:hypothetical protein [Vibrio metschnikovii]
MKEKRKLEINQFVLLNERNNGKFCERLDIATQSIAHFEKYCKFHFYELIAVATPQALRLERLGFNEGNRFIYEAHIVAFMNNLHSMLDSFPFVLNLFIPKLDADNTKVKWSVDFINLYKDCDFYQSLLLFFTDLEFNKVKGYVNNIKHKHLIRIANVDGCLEFEGYKCRVPCVIEDKVEYQSKYIERDNVIQFIKDCFNNLIDKFFALCNVILEYKRTKLAL